MSDVSGNDIFEDLNGQNEIETEISVYESIDYTSYFENLQNISFIILTVLIALGVVIAFINGFGKNG